MTRSQLIDAVAARLGLDRPAAEAVVHTIFRSMQEALEQGDNIELRGFGTFGVRRASGYRGRNPRSGATVDVRSRRMPYFKVGRPLRSRIEGVRPTVTPVLSSERETGNVPVIAGPHPAGANGQSHANHGKAAVPLAARRAPE